ncbi:MAG: MBL fold metallo-hydrolase [Clostridiaceae bacterium]|jgi:L-ascorbate metabolism protein UlaG (beta-lactamase superfamily)|nr:MBL fold metallo-hydrolase [Clostridiaceae bacterium]
MKIQWLGHSAFKLTESTGTSIVIDPYDPYVGHHMQQVSANAVTISHKHKDHSFVQGVTGSPEIIDKVGAYEITGVHIYSILTNHDSAGGTQRGKNLVFKYRMDGVDVCHMGDIGEECDSLFVEAVIPVNVLLIPIGGGGYTVNAAEAKEYVDHIMPDVVIPMHYRTKEGNFNLDKLGEFTDLFDEDQIEYVDGDTVEYDRADFDGDKTKVVILDFAR